MVVDFIFYIHARMPSASLLLTDYLNKVGCPLEAYKTSNV